MKDLKKKKKTLDFLLFFQKRGKGFTLIEILMVVAIIGILATIVIASLKQASNRAKNAKIITDIIQARKIAEMMYLEKTDGYAGLCDASGSFGTDENLQLLQSDIEKYGGSVTCYSSAYSYCVSSQLLSETTKWFCIDDEGASVEITVATNPCQDASSNCE